ncbi:alpha/beta hydrolase [Actinomadura fibrosa]|uniref:Alpha/beta hydrolase n=1 Tax=Actinomadura fibrosa TaxID=111802 RepID=A0ABW2XTD7_9ACTN|nr:alpha/beta fold hydrolase [Actinomadura fibrosa]
MTSQKKISFPADEATLVGNLFLPDGADGPLPGVVVAGTWTSVKEMMADRYAERLADRGLAALSFDFTGFGESGGEPRDFESPELKIRDLRHAVSYLAEHPAVDGDRIGALGVCAGAMYVSAEASEDERVRSLALVAPWLHDAEICAASYGGDEGVAARINASVQARARYDETGEVEYVPAVDAADPRAAMPMDIGFYLDPERGNVPAWPNRFAVMAWEGWLTLDSSAIAADLTVPTLLVHSEEGALPDGARRFYAALTGPKEFLWTEGTQFDFYDQEPQVTIAADAASTHFSATL